MAKTKRTRKASTPPEAPTDVGSVLILKALDDITEADVAAYVQGCFVQEPAKMSKTKRLQFTKAMFKFSTLGWSCYTRAKYKD